MASERNEERADKSPHGAERLVSLFSHPVPPILGKKRVRGESAGREIFRPIEARERARSGATASERNEERADKSPNGAEDARPLPSVSLKIITGGDRLEVHVKQRELLGRNDFFQNRCDALQIAMLDFF